MSKNTSTMLVDIGILLALVAISFGIWYFPWITLLVLALILLGGCVIGPHPE
jgi:uncharacterized membrane protein YesL